MLEVLMPEVLAPEGRSAGEERFPFGLGNADGASDELHAMQRVGDLGEQRPGLRIFEHERLGADGQSEAVGVRQRENWHPGFLTEKHAPHERAAWLRTVGKRLRGLEPSRKNSRPRRPSERPPKAYGVALVAAIHAYFMRGVLVQIAEADRHVQSNRQRSSKTQRDHSNGRRCPGFPLI
jgi:hypothetical protein